MRDRRETDPDVLKSMGTYPLKGLGHLLINEEIGGQTIMEVEVKGLRVRLATGYSAFRDRAKFSIGSRVKFSANPIALNGNQVLVGAMRLEDAGASTEECLELAIDRWVGDQPISGTVQLSIQDGIRGQKPWALKMAFQDGKIHFEA